MKKGKFPGLELGVLATTLLYFAFTLFPQTRKTHFYLVISVLSIVILAITRKKRDLTSPWNSIIIGVSFSNLISVLFFAVNQITIFFGLALVTIFIFSYFFAPLVFLISGIYLISQVFFMSALVKRWDFLELFALTVTGFLLLAVLLYKTAREKGVQAREAEEIIRVSDETRKILISGENSADGGDMSDGVSNDGSLPIEDLTAEIINEVLHRLRSITRAEYVFLFRPVTSTGLKWNIAAHSTEYGGEEDLKKEIDGGWEPIKVPYLLGKEYESAGKEIQYILFPFERDTPPESVYSFPVYFKRTPAAVLYFEKHFPGPFTHSERESVAMGSEFVSRALSLMDIMSKLGSDNRKYAHLNVYIKDMLGAKGLEDIYPAAAGKICAAVEAEFVSILVEDKGIENLRIKGMKLQDEREAGFDPDIDIDATGTIIQWCMDNGMHRIVDYREKAHEKISNLPQMMFNLCKDRHVIIFPFSGNIGQGRRQRGVILIFGDKKRVFKINDVMNVKSIINVTLLALPRAFDYDELEGESRRDPLTGLYNRKELFVKLRGEISKAMRMKGVMSFLLLDIDNFKRLNDTYGHPFGDEVIIAFSRIMQSIVRPYDTVARYGGEEFSIILSETDRPRAKKIADRIRVGVRNKTFECRGKEIKVTVSIGIATYPHDSRSIEELVDMADRALYHSKGSGRDRVTSVQDIRS